LIKPITGQPPLWWFLSHPKALCWWRPADAAALRCKRQQPQLGRQLPGL